MEKIKALLKKLFGLVDTNKDGKISIAEAATAAETVQTEVKKVKAKVKAATKK
mgnify:FL=1|jgi:Ca2+-binding EF-hand superfamily protein